MKVTVKVLRDNAGVYDPGYNYMIPTDVEILGMVTIEDPCMPGSAKQMLRITHHSFQGWLGIEGTADQLIDKINTALCCDESGGLPQLAAPTALSTQAGGGAATLFFTGISTPPAGIMYQVQASSDNWATVAGYNSRSVSPVVVSGLVNGVAYKMHVRSTAPGYQPSDWVEAGATVTPVDLPIPAAPTNFIVDDVANSANWINNPNYLSLTDYEFTTDFGATAVPVTVKPMLVGAGALATGQVGVRVKGVGGTRHPSAWLFNPVPYTAGLLLRGYFFMDDTNATPSLSNILNNGIPFDILAGSDYAVAFTNNTMKFLKVFEPSSEPLKVKNGADIGADLFGPSGLFPTTTVTVGPFRGYIANYKTISPAAPLDFNQ